MNNYEKIYWLTRLDYIQGLLMSIGLASFITLLVFYLWRAGDCYDDDDLKEYNKKYGIIRKVAFSLLITSALLLTFLPSKNDMMMIYAGGKTMDFVQKDSSINKIPAQTTQLIYNYLNKAIEETKK